MEQTSRTKRVPRRARSLPAGRRPFLTPAVWKQAQPGVPKPRKGSRRSFHHLTLVLLAMTWSRGESTPERFERARGIVAICRPKRRRPGRTPQGVPKALVRLLRLSSKVRRFGDRPVAPDRFAQGEVWDWPRDAQGKGLPPWRLRLIRVSGRRKGQGRGQTVDVGLLTHGPGDVAGAGRAVLPAAVGERGPVPDVQAHALDGAAGGPHGAWGAARGVRRAAGLPTAPGPRDVGAAPAPGRARRRVSSVQRATSNPGHPCGVGGGDETGPTRDRPRPVGAMRPRAARTDEREAEAGMAATVAS